MTTATPNDSTSTNRLTLLLAPDIIREAKRAAISDGQSVSVWAQKLFEAAISRARRDGR